MSSSWTMISVTSNSMLCLFPGKLRCKCFGPFKFTQVFQSGAVKLENEKGEMFKANGP